MGGPPPSSPLPLSPQPAPGKPKVLGLPLWGWLGIGLVAVVGIGAVIVTSGDDDDKGTTPGNQTTVVVSTQPQDTAAPDETTAPDITEPESTEPESTEPEETVTTEPSSGGEVAGAPDGTRGTRDAPVAAGEIADIGGGWRLQVLGVTPDAAALVAAENEFNDPPPAGSTFTLVSVAMGYFGLEDPKAAYEPSVSALGGSSVELESGCGSIPDELYVFNDLFAGGVLVGNLCFVTTPADAAGLQLYATGDFFSSDDAVFLEVAQPAAATAMAGLRGPQDGADSTPGRLQPTPLNTAAEVGDGWSVTVSSGARDITDSVLAENSFNEPPPEGFRFIGVDVIYTFNGDGSDSAFTVSTYAVADSNVQLSSDCGVISSPIDDFVDVFAGGSVAGTMCFVVPSDGGTLTLYSRAGFDAGPVMFGTV